MDSVETLSAAVHQAWFSGKETWEDAPEWHRSAVHHQVYFWQEVEGRDLEAPRFFVLSHLVWVRHLKRDGRCHSKRCAVCPFSPCGEATKVMAEKYLELCSSAATTPTARQV